MVWYDMACQSSPKLHSNEKRKKSGSSKLNDLACDFIPDPRHAYVYELVEIQSDDVTYRQQFVYDAITMHGFSRLQCEEDLSNISLFSQS